MTKTNGKLFQGPKTEGVNAVKTSSITPSNLQTPHDPIKIPTALLTKLEELLLKSVWAQETPNDQSNPEKEKQSWREHNTG